MLINCLSFVGAVEVALGRKRGFHLFPLAFSDAMELLNPVFGTVVAVAVADGTVDVVYSSP